MMKNSQKRSKFLLGLGGVLAIAYFSSCLLLFWLQNRLIFNPSPRISQTPADWQLDYENIYLSVEVERQHGERIHGWWIPASSQVSANVLLYLHGKGGNIGTNIDRLAKFHELGFSVLAIDYRGYGLSDGKFPSESRVYRDVEIAWSYLVRDRQVPPEKIIVYGQSLGGAIAIELATQQPVPPGGLIVESSFTSMRDMVDYRYPFLNVFPVGLLLTQEFDSLAKVRTISIPFLFVHGLDDSHVPAQMSRQLFEATSEPKQLLLVPGADHNNVASVSGEQYLQTISNFVQAIQVNN